ncbi:NADPH-dependent FMN reductase [Metabacillus niabensis]|uniref:FMN reductase n=1 Tax=Metabacillus niabensis TaxID=324854 RepID=A0ABT9YWU6_9BACI|nr:NADPH-dependent FMN reductase [Metabacillus niabensis]MDQ0224077.1 FMN reductase [Metabacillus niabensis]PAD70393.1 FMN reductase (NADPH) [Bacillus sp. 7586-K]
MADISIIVGAPNDKSRLYGILEYALTILKRQNITYEIINIHTLPAEDLIKAKFDSAEINRANRIVEQSVGVMILTPVYKASYSGILKSYLDLLPQKIFKNKVILPLVIGGSFGHLLAIEYALNPVLSALGATNILNGVYTVDKQIERVDDSFSIHEEAQQRLKNGLDALTNRLLVGKV